MEKSKDLEVMDKEVFALLDQSICKWERNLLYAQLGKYEMIKIKFDTCPLCHKYIDIIISHGTEIGICSSSCPVKLETGYGGCRGTPWNKVSFNLINALIIKEGFQNTLIKSIREEINFLKSLRPKEHLNVCRIKRQN